MATINRGTYFSSEAKFWSWLSSQLRKTWNSHPTKLDFIKSKRYVKWIGKRPIYHLDCELCGGSFPQKQIQVNHKVTCGNIKEDGYALRMFNVGFEGLEALCIPCHSIVTYSERTGLSIEEARVEKKVVAFGNLPAKEQKAILSKDSKAKNLKERKNEYRLMIKGETL